MNIELKRFDGAVDNLRVFGLIVGFVVFAFKKWYNVRKKNSCIVVMRKNNEIDSGRSGSHLILVIGKFLFCGLCCFSNQCPHYLTLKAN